MISISSLSNPNPPLPTPVLSPLLPGPKISSESHLNSALDSAITGRPRFVGDLNPESVFIASVAARSPPQRDLTQCGVWASSPAGSTSSASQPPEPAPKEVAVLRPYHAYLESIGAFSLPTPRTQKALIDIYFFSVHPLFPVLDHEAFRKAVENSTVSTPLLHAVLLVAARHPTATKHLPSSPRIFAASTAVKVKALLDGDIERDRVTKVRIYALLAFHSEGPSGNETASLNLSTAVHHAYSLGLHLNRPEIQPTDLNLWWSLWALDALQASLCGRPVGVRREDVSLPFPDGVSTPFLTILKITDLLGEVIQLYRPTNDRAGWDEKDFPPLEIPPSTTPETANTLRLYYNAVAILSHRHAPPTSASFRRRLNSAKDIISLFPASADSPTTVFPPVPIVPYAVSLALTTFYSMFRKTREGGHAEFVRACEILEGLGTTWYFAGAMARMGRQAADAAERIRVEEAAGVLRDLQGGSAMMVEDVVYSGDGPNMELDEWFLQLFPDLAAPTGMILFNDGGCAGDDAMCGGWGG